MNSDSKNGAEFAVDLGVPLCGLRLKNPVIAASGTFGFGREYAEYTDLNALGGVSVKGLTLLPRRGNRPPRIAETSYGVLNSVGLQNPGAEAFVRDELPFLRGFPGLVVIANAAGGTIEEYTELVRLLSDAGVDAIELNVSCPNVKEGGMSFGASERALSEVVSAVRPVCKKPLIVKLTPNVTDIRALARAAEDAGADALSLINTLLGMKIDIESRRPVLRNNTGGLSGPAVMPVAVRMTWEAASSVKIPVIGMGGIASGDDAIEFMLAGACAVMVGTANFVGPDVCSRVVSGIEAYCKRFSHSSPSEFVGGLIPW
ncbi:MAG: dihydroorotate dehydrogenase [Clostridiales bacterium]|jgi:dihydroorotate dehydrogenase (NAD+) catalytic subunit|nr:dihydroorotate dehydrogenase [Clostridiales bacterium]